VRRLRGTADARCPVFTAKCLAAIACERHIVYSGLAASIKEVVYNVLRQMQFLRDSPAHAVLCRPIVCSCSTHSE